MRAALFWLGLALCLAVPGGLIAQKERLLQTGRVVLLPLAPVDPRSLMQGDYMDLRYRLADEVFEASERGEAWPERSVVVVRLDADGVAAFARLDRGEALAPDEQRLRYYPRRGLPRFGAESYLFEEGRADYYAVGRYGELRVAEDGTALLAGLRDSDRNPL